VLLRCTNKALVAIESGVRRRYNRKKRCTFFHSLITYEHRPTVCRMGQMLLLGRRPMLAATVSRGKKRELVCFPIASKTTATASSLGNKAPIFRSAIIAISPLTLPRLFSPHERQSREPNSTLISPESIRGWSRTSKDLFFITR